MFSVWFSLFMCMVLVFCFCLVWVCLVVRCACLFCLYMRDLKCSGGDVLGGGASSFMFDVFGALLGSLRVALLPPCSGLGCWFSGVFVDAYLF